jgi:hypothetical protein
VREEEGPLGPAFVRVFFLVGVCHFGWLLASYFFGEFAPFTMVALAPFFIIGEISLFWTFGNYPLLLDGLSLFFPPRDNTSVMCFCDVLSTLRSRINNVFALALTHLIF